MTSSQSVRRLFLHDRHVAHHARLGLFGDWEVPLYYTTILEEHEAVRGKAGLFDISHMGKFEIRGAGTDAALNQLFTRNITKMNDGQALYMPLVNERGLILDDIIVYRVQAAHFFIIVNASNVEKDSRWISSHLPAGLEFIDHTTTHGLLALQGPARAAILAKALGDEQFGKLRYYHFALWKKGLIARTGYTGEDGFEIMAEAASLNGIWDSLMEAGRAHGLVPAGFGARDTLRLEAGMPLYGHDMNEDTDPFEAGIGWAVDLTKENFLGKAALAERKNNLRRKIAGFEMIDRGIPRQDYPVLKSGKNIGAVTSGTFSPTLKSNIGMAFVPLEEAVPGNEVEVSIRGKGCRARIVKLPFYKRPK